MTNSVLEITEQEYLFIKLTIDFDLSFINTLLKRTENILSRNGKMMAILLVKPDITRLDMDHLSEK